MTDKTYEMDERQKLFFDKLFDLKDFIKNKANESNDQDWQEAYRKIDQIIKHDETRGPK